MTSQNKRDGNITETFPDWDNPNMDNHLGLVKRTKIIQIGIRLTFGWIKTPSKFGLPGLGWQ
jgi:hypothetical protein